MNKLRLAFAAALCVGLLGGYAAPLQAATYKIRWMLGHRNLDYFEEAALEFKKAVETGTNGDIKVDISFQADDAPSSGPAQTPEIAGMVSRGEAEMGHSFVDVIGGLDPRFHAFKAPYLFRGYRHQEGVFEGALGAELLEGLRAHDIVGLSFTYSGGASGIATVDRELRRPEDLEGLKVGVFGDEIDEAWLKSLGAVPVPIGHELERIVPSARSGALDAVLITWRNFERARLETDFKHVNMMGAAYLVSVTYINEKFFDGLPENYRALIMKASREAGRIERAKTIELNENAKLALMSKGVRGVHLTVNNRGRFVSALKPAYTGTIERRIGRELLDRIRSSPDAANHPSVPKELARR